MHANLSVDIAIVAYRRWDLTKSCLEHLLGQTRSHRVYVCDNGCDQRTAERVSAEYPAATVVRLERNMPYAVATGSSPPAKATRWSCSTTTSTRAPTSSNGS